MQRRKEELVELVEKARDLSLDPIDDGEKPEDVIAASGRRRKVRFLALQHYSPNPNRSKGYRLFWDGHVLKLMYNKNPFDGYHFVRFGVKPTERE